MTQPLGNCPGCGGDEPFEQVHPDARCPDAGGECPEWVCPACAAGVFMGTLIMGTRERTPVLAGQSVRAA